MFSLQGCGGTAEVSTRSTTTSRQSPPPAPGTTPWSDELRLVLYQSPPPAPPSSTRASLEASPDGLTFCTAQGSKTKEQVRCYYYRVVKKLSKVIQPTGTCIEKNRHIVVKDVIKAILAWWYAPIPRPWRSRPMLRKCASSQGVEAFAIMR